MTNAQTEARAVALVLGYYIAGAQDGLSKVPVGALSRIATALAAKDAERSRTFDLLKLEQDRAERAEAALAEARKALEPFAGIADTEDAVGRDDPDDDRVWVVQAHGCQIGDLTIEDFRAARRALTGGQEDG